MSRRNQPTPPESAGRGRGRGRGRASAGQGRGQPYVPVTRPPPPVPSPSPAPPPAAVIGSPAQAHAAASASSSSAPPPAPVTEEVLSADVEKLALQPAETALPPSSSKAVRFPRRPGYGTVGRKIQVRANHFLVQVSDRDLHHYDVAITPEVTSKSLCRALMNQLVRMHQNTVLGNRIPVYDGRKSIYTAGALPFHSQEFVVKLDDDNDRKGASSSGSASKKREREFKVTIRLAAKKDLYQLQQFLRRQQLDCPYETIQALDVALRASPTEKYNISGRSFFSPELGRTGSLGGGVEYWKGYYQSLRPTQMGLSLNIDVSSRSYYEPILVTDFVTKHFNFNLSRPLSDQDRVLIKKTLRGVKVEVHLNEYTRGYKVIGVSKEPLKELMFTLDDKKTKTSVVQYFREKYRTELKYLNLPAIQVGSDAKPVYLPMEVCQIAAGQRYTKRLSEAQVAALLRANCQRPYEREKDVRQVGGRNTVLEDAARFTTPLVSEKPSAEISGHCYSHEDDFLKVTPRKTIEELKYRREDGDYAVYATIKGVDGGPNWFITACRCGTEVVPQSGSYYCDKCEKHVVNVIPRYKIKARVIDASDSATFVISENLGCLLLHKSCTEMLKSTENDGLNLSQPLAFQQMLIDRSFIFKVEVKNSCFNELEPSYDVIDICFNDSIISQFKDLNPAFFSAQTDLLCRI